MDNREVMSFEKKGLYEEATAKKHNPDKVVFLTALVLLTAEFLNIALWQFGAIGCAVSAFASAALVAGVGFISGRIYEKFCK